MNTKTLKEIFDTPVEQLLEMEEADLSKALRKAELLVSWLRGISNLKSHNQEIRGKL